MPKMTDEEILAKVREFRDDAISGNMDKFERMGRAQDFKVGRQWDPGVKAENEAKGKFCLTIPLVKPTIKQVVGTEIDNPKDFKVKPVRAGTSTSANILTALAKHAMDSEHAKFEKTQTFEAGITTAEGNLGFFIDKRSDPKHGNLTIEKLNEFEVMWDPTSNVYDPNSIRAGAKYCIWSPWVDKDQVHKEYPDKMSELEGRSDAAPGVMGYIQGFVDWMVGAASTVLTTFGIGGDGSKDEISKYRYCKTHTWWREAVTSLWWYDLRKSELDAMVLVPGAMVDFENPETGEVQRVEVTEKMIKNVRKRVEDNPEVFELEETVYDLMHHTINIGEVFLEDRVDELNLAQSGITFFPIVRFNPNFDNGFQQGMAEDMIGTQEEINYTHSMKLNIIKKLANTGYIIKEDVGDNYKQWLEDHGGEDGVVLEEIKGGGKVEKIKPNEYPVGADRMTEQAKENLKLITNVRTEDPSTDKDRVASAIMLKQRASIKGHSPTMMNWDYSMSIGGNLLIEIIRHNDIYSEDEIREIVSEDELIDQELMTEARQIVRQQFEGEGWMDPPQEPMITDPEAQAGELAQYQQQVEEYTKFTQTVDELARPIAEAMLMDEIHHLRKGRYSTKVTLSPYAPTLRMAKTAELFELNEVLLKNQQVPVSRKLLVEATDVDNKEEIIEDGERQMAQMAGAK